MLLTVWLVYEGRAQSTVGLQAGSNVELDGAAGQRIYSNHCLQCHGLAGDGDGNAAYLLFPKPRDFTAGIYKFTSTASGDPPTDSDLKRTVHQGMPGTSMPSFGAVLSDEQISRVVDYIREFEPPHPAPRVIIPEQPQDLSVDIENGKLLFTNLGCVQCHGEDGMADTPTAKTLTDTWGEPNPPAPLAYGIFKGGDNLEDVFRTILAGIKGTAMPAFAPFIGQQNLTEQSFWDLAAYVLSLAENKDRKLLSDEVAEVPVHIQSHPIPEDPWDVQWDTIQPVVVQLHPLWKRPAPPPPISVRAMHNGETMAMMFEWKDGTKDWAQGSLTFSPDAVAVQYPVRGNEAPFIGMGAEDIQSLLRIWHWQAHREQRIANRDFRDIEQAYPNLSVDWYPGELNRRIGERPTFQGNEDGLLKQGPHYLPAMAVENPLLDRDLLDHSALEYLCQGYGSLTGLPPERHYVSARGVWLQGKWRVVMQRPMETRDAEDRVFRTGEDLWLALAVWDGFYGDRNGQKSVSRWIRFHLGE